MQGLLFHQALHKQHFLVAYQVHPFVNTGPSSAVFVGWFEPDDGNLEVLASGGGA